MSHAAAPSGLDGRPLAPIALRQSPPSGRKNAHRGLAACRRTASGQPCSQVLTASGKNRRSPTTARRSHLLQQTNQCGVPSALPHGVGISAGGGAEAGLPKALGAGANGAVGAGEFYSSTTGFSHGGFAEGGATAYAGNLAVGAPAQTSAPGVALASVGAGASIFVTNAQSVQQLSGPFTTYSLNVGVGPFQFSAQLALGGNIWDFSLSPPLGGVTFGVSGSKITTNTVTTSGGCH